MRHNATTVGRKFRRKPLIFTFSSPLLAPCTFRNLLVSLVSRKRSRDAPGPRRSCRDGNLLAAPSFGRVKPSTQEMNCYPRRRRQIAPRHTRLPQCRGPLKVEHLHRPATVFPPALRFFHAGNHSFPDQLAPVTCSPSVWRRGQFPNLRPWYPREAVSRHRRLFP
jgi:hypothetical protein